MSRGLLPTTFQEMNLKSCPLKYWKWAEACILDTCYRHFLTHTNDFKKSAVLQEPVTLIVKLNIRANVWHSARQLLNFNTRVTSDISFYVTHLRVVSYHCILIFSVYPIRFKSIRQHAIFGITWCITQSTQLCFRFLSSTWSEGKWT